ncbi:lipocalin family protein [uncultured Ilyobacter sp.]|uniref:lipocalin family protein n=1 Tax=uncultured Ilyobacter sp. TaxID=544433 RepID=UPI0029F4DBCC|nr:lipocalin family protein [uncultured Ilyobacter sp.]
MQTISGTARVPDPNVPAKLKVRFFPLFEANYWILDLDTENYEWAVVGEPFRLTFWILSRTPTIDENVYQAILDRMPEMGI